MTDATGRQMTYAEVAAEMALAHRKSEFVSNAESDTKAELARTTEQWAPFGPCPSNE